MNHYTSTRASDEGIITYKKKKTTKTTKLKQKVNRQRMKT